MKQHMNRESQAVSQSQREQPREPFFARLLENQHTTPAMQTGIKAGKLNQTMKYPSDNDEW